MSIPTEPVWFQRPSLGVPPPPRWSKAAIASLAMSLLSPIGLLVLAVAGVLRSDCCTCDDTCRPSAVVVALDRLSFTWPLLAVLLPLGIALGLHTRRRLLRIAETERPNGVGLAVAGVVIGSLAIVLSMSLASLVLLALQL